ncbi:MAG: hypothetical protein OSA93_16200 [Akkermansiaceae bacterium]|jgi:hypothetical protein|nr:hypothetical protein [Akkermansiaceae bacterium]
MRITQLAGHSKSAQNVPATHLDGVILAEIQTTNVVQLGPQLVALQAWNELNLTSLLESCGMKNPTIATARLMIINRLIEPLSEWALIDWSERTALPELLAAQRRSHHQPPQTQPARRRPSAGLQTARHRLENRVPLTPDRTEKSADFNDIVVPCEGNSRFHRPSIRSVRNLG